MTTATADLSFSLARVMRQAATAVLFILLVAGYSASHPASFQTPASATTATAANTVQTTLVPSP